MGLDGVSVISVCKQKKSLYLEILLMILLYWLQMYETETRALGTERGDTREREKKQRKKSLSKNRNNQGIHKKSSWINSGREMSGKRRQSYCCQAATDEGARHSVMSHHWVFDLISELELQNASHTPQGRCSTVSPVGASQIPPPKWARVGEKSCK